MFFVFGSDGSQMEGDDAEAARFAVAHNVNVKVIVDDNDVTISGHPSQYLPGYDIGKTLKGHGLHVDTGNGENVEALYTRMLDAVRMAGPVALINKRKMAPGIAGLEGSHAGHDVINKELALAYLREKGHTEAVTYLEGVKKVSSGGSYRGCTTETASNRTEFGNIVNGILDRIGEAAGIALAHDP